MRPLINLDIENEIKIKEEDSEVVLLRLIKLAEKEKTSPALWYTLVKVISVLIGYYSAYIYIGPTRRAAAHTPTWVQYSALAGTVGSNANDNAFFNLDMARDIFYLLTKQWSVSKLELFSTFFVSIVSSLPFAFMDIDDLDKEGPIFADLTLAFLIFVYAAQHYFSVFRMQRKLLDFLGRVYNFFRCQKATPNALDAKAAKADLLARIQKIASKYGKNENPELTRAANFLIQHNNANTLKVNDLVSKIMAIDLSDSPPPTEPGFVKRCLINLAQLTGLSVQVIANLGYVNSTIKGMQKLLSVNSRTAKALAGLCMTPVYGLAFILSYETVNNLIDFLGSVLSKIYQGKFKEIADDIPYSMRKAPIFSLVTSGGLLYLAVFSPFTAVGLIDNALYSSGGNFTFLDDAEETGRTWYIGITAVGTVIFNAFPVFPLVKYLSELYCSWFKDSTVQTTLYVEQILNELYEKVNRIPEKDFGIAPDPISLEEKQEIKSLPTPTSWSRKDIWTCLGDGVGYLSSCVSSLFCCTRSRPRKSELTDPLLLNGNFPSRVELKSKVFSRPPSPSSLDI